MPIVPTHRSLVFRLLIGLLGYVALALATLQAATVTATFAAATETPIIASGYAATGDDLQITLGFAPSTGTNLTVIKNTAIPFISGTFGNVPNGSTVNLTYDGTTYPFVAWYYGGDGNDLVLLWPVTALAAWGSNFNGSLGDNTTTHRSVPTAVDQTGVLAGKTIVQVVRGGAHTLALTSEGLVYAWGTNSSGQLGDGTTTHRKIPVAVSTAGGASALSGKSVVSLSAGFSHSLALCSDGSVVAWGDNSSGQLGDGGTTQRKSPVAVNITASSALLAKSVVAVSGGGAYSLVLCSDGTLAAWGDNYYGQLGDGTTLRRLFPVKVNSAVGVSALYGKSVLSPRAGAYHALALCSDGSAVGWGYNVVGQLGDGTTTQRTVPVNVNTAGGSGALLGKTITSLLAGVDYSLALCADGSLAAWGANSDGQLGDGSFTTPSSPVSVSTGGSSALAGQTVAAISVGASHALALCANGAVAAWGYNSNGRLGDASTVSRSVPVAVNTGVSSVLAGRAVAALAGGSCGQHSVAVYNLVRPVIKLEVLEPAPTSLVSGAGVVSFGTALPGCIRTFRLSNSAAGSPDLKALGLSLGGTDSGAFTLIDALPATVANGQSATFRISLSSVVIGNKNAVLNVTSGDGMTLPFSVGLEGIVESSASVTFATPSDTPLVLWNPTLSGSTLDMTLGFAPSVGAELTVIKNVGQAFIAGSFGNVPNGATVNLIHDGKTYPFIAWYYGGDGNDFVLRWPTIGLAGWGLTTSGERNIPDAMDQSGILKDKTIIQVVRGGSHTLVLTNEGRVYAWGDNSYGQLGDGSTVGRFTAVAVGVTAGSSALAGKSVVAVAAGSNHSLALCSDGLVAAWGENLSGQLGDGSTTRRLSPVAVGTAAGTSALAGKSVVGLAAGNSFSLALCSDGSAAAWGNNGYGQLGNNATTQRSLPVAVNVAAGTSALAGRSVVSLAAGFAHVLALCSDGTLVSWGLNSSGQLGDASLVQRTVPVLVNTTSASALFGKSIRSIAAGATHSLVVCADGAAVAWGSNGSGQLGDGTTTQRSLPAGVNAVPGTSALAGKSVVAVAAGYSHSFALCSDNTILSWGYNYSGELGDRSNIQRLFPVVVDTGSASALSAKTVTALVPGAVSYHSMALYAAARQPALTVEALDPEAAPLASGLATVDFGTALSGGGVRTFRITNTAVDTLPLQGLGVTFAGADASSFAVVDPLPASLFSGESATFRVNLVGPVAGPKTATLQLAHNGDGPSPFTVALVGAIPANVAATFNTSTDGAINLLNANLSGTTIDLTLGFVPPVGAELTVIRNAGRPFIAGAFDNLPNGSTVNLVHDGKTYSFIAWYYGGDGNDLVLRWPTTGLAAWGRNANGQLGDSTPHPRTLPVAVDPTAVLAGGTIVQSVGGSGHTLALTSDGQVYAWGDNTRGQLGDGTTVSRYSPVAVNTGGSSALAGKFVVALAAGGLHSLALCSDGTVAAWGDNLSYQLGDGSSTPRSLPAAVNTADGASALAGKSVVAISAGHARSLVLCSDGSVVGWGRIDLGSTSSVYSSQPTAVDTGRRTSALFGKSVVALSAGSNHSLALCSDGSLVAWGSNEYAELGNGSTVSTNSPVAVSSVGALAGKSIAAFVAGGHHSLVLCTDGSLLAWGLNFDGQLGDGTTTRRDTPVVTGIAEAAGALAGRSVTALSAGSSHSLVLCSDGALVSWGANSYGQLGDGSIVSRSTPTLVDTVGGVIATRSVTTLASGSGMGHTTVIYASAALPSIELEVLEPAVATLTSGADTVDFGAAMSGGSVRTFRISSPTSDSLPLQGLEFGFEGTDAGAFTFLPNLPASVPSGRSVTFQVCLTGPSEGVKNAVLRITGHHGLTAPFLVNLTGGLQTHVAVTLSSPTAGAPVLTGPDLSASTLDLTLDFAPTPGACLTVVKNAGLPFIAGAFANLPHGARIDLAYAGQTYPFTAWYYGGDGNDLVLLPARSALAAWGDNLYGQLGDNTCTQLNLPAAADPTGVLADKTVVQIARGYSHSLALTEDGRVYAWGANTKGQLGDGTTLSSYLPVAVNVAAGSSALAGKFVVAVAAGGNYSLALCSDGSVAAWGENLENQLGDGTTSQRLIPVPVVATGETSALRGKSVVAVSAGFSHSLALCSDGRVVAWGSGSYGQLGEGFNNPRGIPVAVDMAEGFSALGGKSVVAISAGGYHSLALCADGSVSGWGYNYEGQLGDGSASLRNRPVAVDVASGSALAGKAVLSVSAGKFHSIALCADGSVASWGRNNEGQLGDGSTTQRNIPVAVDAGGALLGKSVAAISAGAEHSVGLCTDGSVFTWGYNLHGELGDLAASSRALAAPVDTASGPAVLLSKSVVFLALGSSAQHSLVSYGAANLPGLALEVLEPVATPLHSGVGSVAFGSALPGAGVRTFRITNTGTNSIPLRRLAATFGGAGLDSFTLLDQFPSTLLNGESATFRISLNGSGQGLQNANLLVTSTDAAPLSVALSGTLQTGIATTFSSPSGGELALASPDLSGSTLSLSLNFTPPAGTNLSVVKNTGSAFMRAFSNVPNGSTVNLAYNGVTYPFIAWYYGGDGNDLVFLWPSAGLATWGSNFTGELGNGSTVRRIAPAAMDQYGVLRGKTIVQVAHGYAHTLALTSEGKVYAWGWNESGQLGDNTTLQRTSPVPVNNSVGISALSGKFVVAISAGQSHSVALCSDGSIAAWGSNSQGSLGDGSLTQRLAPVAVTASGLSALSRKSVVAISAGQSHSLALCSDGSLVAWGSNGYGQLGSGSQSSYHPLPVMVSAAKGGSALSGKSVSVVSAGGSHSLALCSDGSLVAWGSNSVGQVGDGSLIQRNVPVAVDTSVGSSALAGKTVSGISAGSAYSLAVCSDGSVCAWGYNFYGQLGDNSTTNRSLPVAITGALDGKSVVRVSAHLYHSLALCADGSLAAWGSNGSGGLGDNSVIQRLAPVLVNTAAGTSVLAGRPATFLAVGITYGHSAALYATASPVVTLGAPTGITGTGATLRATVNPLGTPTTAQFEYGLTPDLGTTAPITLSPIDGTAAQSVGVALSGLKPGTIYYHRVSASIFAGTANSDPLTFRTLNNVSSLSRLLPDLGPAASPAFLPDVTNYSLSTFADSLTLSPAPTDPAAFIRLNGVLVDSSGAPISRSLALGTNVFMMVVTAEDGVTTTSYTLTATRVLAPAASWKLEHFGASAGDLAVAGDTADPDGDGLGNLLEYATRADPNANGASPLGAPVSVFVQPGDIPAREFVFPYRAEATDVRYLVQRSSNLSTWTDVYRYDGDTGQSTPFGDAIAVTDPTAQTITLTDPATGAKLFWRLSVEPAP